MRRSCRPLAGALAIVVLAACGSSKSTSGASTTTAASSGPTVPAGGATRTTIPLVQKFVYQPDGFCAAFSNYLVYVAIAAAPFASDSTDTSTTIDAATNDAKAGAAALAFAPAIAPTTDVLRTDAPEEVLAVFREFDEYNDEAVKALAALGVDTDKLGPTVAAELAKIDLAAPGDLPTTESAATAGGIDAAQLSDAGKNFVQAHGTLEAVFDKYSELPDPTTERQQELIAKYPCLATALATGG